LDELSKVYRYLLSNNQESISTVENEIKFILSYFQLLLTRFGKADELNIKIEKQFNSYLLPSLTLQLLVENAVKHNSLSKNQPLIIDIFTTANKKLIINNNLQRSTINVHSNGIGLNNIKSKYLLLKQKDFQVIQSKEKFTVILPLILNQQPEESILE
jgi:two-component system, LytTR family, sensor kinase